MDDKTDKAEGQEDGRGRGGDRERQDRGGTAVPPPAAGKDESGEAKQAAKTIATRTARAGGRSQGIWDKLNHCAKDIPYMP